jgi:hypothetical protein
MGPEDRVSIPGRGNDGIYLSRRADQLRPPIFMAWCLVKHRDNFSLFHKSMSKSTCVRSMRQLRWRSVLFF